MSKDTGGPAYPSRDREFTNGRIEKYMGMTLRDYFAGQISFGLLANPQTKDLQEHSARFIAKISYEIADAMIKERSKDE